MDSNSSTFFLLFKTCFSIPGFRPKQNSGHMFRRASSDHQSGPNLSIKVGQFTVSKWANSEYRNHIARRWLPTTRTAPADPAMGLHGDLDQLRSPLTAMHSHLLVYEPYETLHLIQDGLKL